MSCNDIITSGVTKDCASISASIGVDKDLILVNYDDFERDLTIDVANIEADDTNHNIGGLTSIKLKNAATQYTFEGTDFSVVPNVTSEVKDDGDSWFLHSIAFVAYNKTSVARKVFKELANSRVIAITKDRSTGLYELFGMDQGLKLSEITRAYVGEQKSNFYGITIATPDVAVIRESGVGELAVDIVEIPIG